MTFQDILADYKELTQIDIDAALSYAADQENFKEYTTIN
jgi:uncharacterized protein (DUF433 family)